MRVEHDAVATDERVVDEPLHLDRTEADPAHVRVARYVVEVVDGCGPAEDRLQCAQPAGRGVAVNIGISHHPRDPLRIDVLTRLEAVRGARAQRLNDIGELMIHEVASDHFMVEVPLFEHFVVEEVTERPVPDVVEQPRDAQRLLDECG